MISKTLRHLQDTGLTRRQLVELFGIHYTNKFLKWMRGQTVGSVENCHIYYYWDIKRFFFR